MEGKEIEAFENKLLTMQLSKEKIVSDEEMELAWHNLLLSTDSSLRKDRKSIPLILKVAAGIILLLSSILIFRTSHKTYKTSLNEISTFNMEDGTVITLNTSGKLDYDRFSTKRREVSLNGEAFFQVRKDTIHPFIINTPHGSVKVLGTSFNVKTTKKETITSVHSGSVRLQSKKGFLVLGKQETGMIDQEGHLLSGDFDPNMYSWHSHELTLHEQSMEATCKLLSELFGVAIEVSEEAKECEISAKVVYETMEDLLDIISLTLNLNWTKEENKIIFYGKTC